MKLSDFDYKLPKELIANCHVEPRDHSRLLVVDRNTKKAEDRHFYDILDYLNKGDVLVFNNSKVFKARIYGNKETGGKVEMLLVRPHDSTSWEALVRGKTKIGDKILFADNLEAEILEKNEKSCKVRLNKSTSQVFKYLEKYGEVPLPPYVERIPEVGHRGVPRCPTSGFYQTVYAKSVGSVAAPTAGFHFTPELINKIKAKGVEVLEVTLHVGPGTFLPVESENVTDHKMHEEFFEVKKDVWDRIVEAHCHAPKRRVIAVGTTTCRTLETLGKKFSILNSH